MNEPLDIMIVDDDPDSRKALQIALKPLGYALRQFESPLEALAAYKKRKADIVLTDMRMPQMTGIELLKALRKYDKDVKVIVITAYGDLDCAMNAINNHALGFFAKPINIEELYACINSIRADLTRQNESEEDRKRLQVMYGTLSRIYKELLSQLSAMEKGANRS